MSLKKSRKKYTLTGHKVVLFLQESYDFVIAFCSKLKASKMDS